jgi:two-component system, response regulator PdtaR
MDQQQEVVLVVDDEPLVRLDASETLYSAGFEVCEAASVLEALTVLDERPDVTVLLTDVQMPGRMSGFDLAKHVRETRPAVAVLLVSGCKRPDGMSEGVEFLSKPCRTDILVACVRAAVKGGATHL